VIDDAERLQALRASGLLDKDTAARLDHLAFAAARLVLADVAQINAVDHETTYTVVGWPPGVWPDKPARLTGCWEIIRLGRPLIVNDANTHPITCNLPWVPIMQSYLGVPVFFDTHVVGSVCVLSAEPRTWKSMEICALEGVARLVGMSLEDAPLRS
jgi:GAF domain-containing protein